MSLPETPAAAIDRLKEGNARVAQDTPKPSEKEPAATIREAATKGQHPYAIVLSCADSRVVPEEIFDEQAGKLFVIRVAGNIANASSLASIEYAVANIDETKVIVVMGHEACGAVKATIDSGDQDLGPNLNHLVSYIKPAVEAAGAGTEIRKVVEQNAVMTVERMLKDSSIIKDAADAGKVQVVPAYYNFRSGAVDFLDNAPNA